RRERLRGRLERRRLLLLRDDRQALVGLPRGRQGQGRARDLRQPGLLRRLRRARLRPERDHRQAALEEEGPAAFGSGRRLLPDAGDRLRPRLQRLDGRQGVLLRRGNRAPALVAVDRRVRLLVGGGLAAPRLRGLLLGLPLLLRRRDRR